jgi:hypothetical protein
LIRPSSLLVGFLLLYLLGWSQRLARASPKSIPGLNQMEPHGRRAGGWCEWPMDGHMRCADVLDDGVTARAAMCHSCLLRRPLPVHAMLMHRGAGASPVPHTCPDASTQAQLAIPRSLVVPGQGEEVPKSFPGQSGPRLGLAALFICPRPLFRGIPGKRPWAAPFPYLSCSP